MRNLCVTIIIAAVALVTLPTMAMNHNLLAPWANPPRCSPPQTPLFAFFNRENGDFMFKDGGEKVEIWCQAGVRTANGLSWSLHHNQLKKPFRTGVAESRPGNLFRIEIPAVDLKPGFYDVRVKLEGLGYEKLALFHDPKNAKAKLDAPTGVCTFGWKPDEMPIVDADAYRPAGFKAFWKAAMEEYRAIPLDLRVEDEPKTFKGEEIDRYNMESACLPPEFDPDGRKFDEVVSYKASFAGPDGTASYGAFDASATAEMRALAYFDPINFAPYAKCPAYFNGGLIDPVSPAYSTYSAYLRWGGADKTFTAVAGHGHDWWAAFDRAAYRWLEKTIGREAK